MFIGRGAISQTADPRIIGRRRGVAHRHNDDDADDEDEQDDGDDDAGGDGGRARVGREVETEAVEIADEVERLLRFPEQQEEGADHFARGEVAVPIARHGDELEVPARALAAHLL